MQGSVSHPWLEQVEHSGKEFVSLRVRSSVGFPPGRRETSLGRAGAKAIATVLLFGGRADPAGSRGRGCRGGCASGRNESTFQSQDKCEEGAPQGLHQGEACPQRCPLLGKDRTEQGEGGVGVWLGAAELPSAPEGCLRGVRPAPSSAFFAGKLVALAIFRELSVLRSPELSVIVSSASTPSPAGGLGGRGTSGLSRCWVAETGRPPPGGCVCERGVN